jgi:membrane associated rhomboid family serine protease
MGFGPPVTPNVVKQLLIANLAVFVAQVLMPGLTDFGAVWPRRVLEEGWLWQPFTYMWLHSGLAHIAMNMFVLWMFGSPMALVWGPRRFLRFYLLCGIGAGVLIALVPYLLVGIGAQPQQILRIPTLGASGAVYGVLLAYSLTWPDRTIMLIFPPVAFRAIWLIPILFFMEFAFGAGNVSHVGHLGGVLVAWLYLRRQGGTAGLLPTRQQLQYRWHRWRMRRRLRAVREDDRRGRTRDDDHRTLH